MAIKTYDEYLASLKAMKPNVYKFDQLIEDVTTHPATKRTVEGHAWTFKAADLITSSNQPLACKPQ